MSLARAFTTRRFKRSDDIRKDEAAGPGRTMSLRKPGSAPIQRSAISGPVALISTTNMLSYNAPDIMSIRHVSSSAASATSSSGEDSDVTSAASLHDTDASSVSSSSPVSPKPNHLTTYFARATTNSSQTAPAPPLPVQSPHRSSSSTELRTKAQAESSTPSLPKRAPSHSKSAHVQLARQRSMRSSSSSSLRLSSEQRASIEHRSSADIFRVAEDPTHPFSNELQQLQEVVEEFGDAIAEVTHDEDVKYMSERSLASFSVADYLCEIQPLVIAAFKHKQIVAVQAGWI